MRRPSIKRSKTRAGIQPLVAIPIVVKAETKTISRGTEENQTRRSVEVHRSCVLVSSRRRSIGGRNRIPLIAIPFPDAAYRRAEAAIKDGHTSNWIVSHVVVELCGWSISGTKIPPRAIPFPRVTEDIVPVIRPGSSTPEHHHSATPG